MEEAAEEAVVPPASSPGATVINLNVLKEAWASWEGRIANSVIYFFHQDHAHYGVFSNFYEHGVVSCVIPPECGGAALEAARAAPTAG